MALMLRSLASSFSSERTPLPCIDALPLSRTSIHRDGGKVRRTPEPVRASPYPPLKRSSGYGSKSLGPPLKRMASLHGGDSLASLQRAATEAKQSICKPHSNKRKSNGPLRPALSLANTLVLDSLVCPPPVPLAMVHPIVPNSPAPKLPVPTTLLRRRSSLAPESGPTALVPRNTHVALPAPPCLFPKRRRESLAQRTLRRQFERTPRGAQVKALGAHAALRMMSEAEEEEAVAAVFAMDDPDDVCMADSWVDVASEEMEWSLVDGAES
ncbi:hypothetical protein RSOL_455370 [Rhizoctonia solani AG-3 Rhs1AP]|uniref:Uncharacterized protein n=1 Tax=Rhizoctonia solani AG-3 Rhs1AP TaxID=1086054 RepID=X8JFU9_9AGAM|nr:hypothetical protein RSOL_455370 [Rhizoctonia solani AG-3 Rhs1AP]